jgi:PPM family protein phosphatase
MRMQIRSCGLSDVGRQRQHNEDTFLIDQNEKLFLVADGMGGHAAGEVASRIAVETIEAFIESSGERLPDETWPVVWNPALSGAGNRLSAAFALANRRLAEEARQSFELRGMATTASAVLLGETDACVAHVGDSRVYVLREAALRQITADHSWVEEQVRAGTLTASAARQHPWRNVVTRALSGGDDPEVDVTQVTPAAGDRYLLCSDGLFGVVNDARIAELLAGEGPLDEVCQKLIDAANEGGGPDNITALVLQIDAQ